MASSLFTLSYYFSSLCGKALSVLASRVEGEITPTTGEGLPYATWLPCVQLDPINLTYHECPKKMANYRKIYIKTSR